MDTRFGKILHGQPRRLSGIGWLMKSKLLVVAALGLAFAGAASAVTITSPMSLSQQFIVGIHNGQQGNSNPTTEAGIAQAILDLAQGQTSGFNQSNTAFDYSGTITLIGPQVSSGFDGVDGVAVPAGWGGAIAKYDGPNGGYVLFAFGGQASVIPEFPYNFWTTQTDKYQISHYTLLSGTGGLTPTPTGTVPDGGSMIALLGMALGGLELARRKFSLASA